MMVMTLIPSSLDQYSVEREHTAGERKSPEVEGHQTPNTKPLSLSFRYFYVDNNLTKIYEKFFFFIQKNINNILEERDEGIIVNPCVQYLPV